MNTQNQTVNRAIVKLVDTLTRSIQTTRTEKEMESKTR